MLAMLLGRWMIAGIAVCVLLLFFFPAVQGSFQATHGPTTAFRARMAFLILMFSVAHGALGVFDHFPPSTLTATGRDFLSQNSIATSGLAATECVALRC